MTTIHTDVADTTNEDAGINDAADAFSKMFGEDAPNEPSDAADEDKKKRKTAEEEQPTDDEVEGDAETSEETPEDEEGAEDDEAEGDEDKEAEEQPTVEIKDDHKFKVTVDGQEQEFTLGSLKRLAGQEASLTKKSQAVAAKIKTNDEHGAVLLAQSKMLLDRAKARYEPYSKIDLLAASKDPNISQEQLIAVRDAAKQAYEDVQYLEQETNRVAESLRTQARQDLMSQANESIKVLSDPEKGIEGFNQKMYADICTFAVEQGLPTEIVNDLVNPAAIKLINMARMFAKGQKTVQSAKTDKKAPKRIVKGTASADATKTANKTGKSQEPMKKLKKSGSFDDAIDAFAASFAPPED